MQKKINTNIKEIAKETSQKAKDQFDSIIEKKPIDKVKLPLPVKLFAILCIVQCVFTSPTAYNYIFEFINAIKDQSIQEQTASSIIMTICFLVFMVITIGLLIAIGVNMLLNLRHVSAVLANIACITIIVTSFTQIMVKGINEQIYIQLITLVLLVAVKSYLDPNLSEERKKNKQKKDEKLKKEQEDGYIGFHKEDGRPKLNYFNIF